MASAVGCNTIAYAVDLGVGPESVEFEVPCDNCTNVSFFISSENNVNLEISLEDIPLDFEPKLILVPKGSTNKEVIITFYGDESLGSVQYEGKVRFMALNRSDNTADIKINAKVNHTLSNQGMADVSTKPDENGAVQTNDDELPFSPIAGSILFASIIIIIAIIAKRGF